MTLTRAWFSAFFSAYRWQVMAVAFALVAGVSFAAGMKLRGLSCDLVEAQRDASDAAAEVAIQQQARATDHANTRAADKTEAARVVASARTDDVFRSIDEEVNAYAAARPQQPPATEAARTGNRADAGRPLVPATDSRRADFLRAWNAANARRLPAEPEHSGGTAGDRAH